MSLCSMSVNEKIGPWQVQVAAERPEHAFPCNFRVLLHRGWMNRQMVAAALGKDVWEVIVIVNRVVGDASEARLSTSVSANPMR